MNKLLILWKGIEVIKKTLLYSAGKMGNDNHIHILCCSSTNNILFCSIIAAIGRHGSVNSILTSIVLAIIGALITGGLGITLLTTALEA